MLGPMNKIEAAEITDDVLNNLGRSYPQATVNTLRAAFGSILSSVHRLMLEQHGDEAVPYILHSLDTLAKSMSAAMKEFNIPGEITGSFEDAPSESEIN